MNGRVMSAPRICCLDLDTFVVSVEMILPARYRRYTAAGAKITNMDRCAELFPIASDARIVAGAPLANDVLKCTLKLLYASVR